MTQMDPIHTPNRLKSTRSIGGVRRLNKLPILIVVIVLCIVVSSLIFTISSRNQPQIEAPQTEQTHHIQDPISSVKTLLHDVPEGLIPAVETPILGTPSHQQLEPITPHLSAIESRYSTPERRTETPKDREKRRIEEKKKSLFEEALHSGTSIHINQGTNPSLPSNTSSTNEVRRNSLDPPSPSDPNKQDQKLAFLEGNKTDSRLPYGRDYPLTNFEVKAGTVIPAIMVVGINSDLPGIIKAQVSQDVYDTATGAHLLIPKGATILGAYDSQVSRGQSRILAAWNRIIFPDGSSIHLGTMPGADQAGYGGFKDIVDRHGRRLFGNAFLLSLISAGIQLSQPNTTSTGAITPEQRIAAAIGQQMGQVGIELIRKELDVQPTLKTRPAYRFNVMVNKDMVFTHPYSQ